MKDPARAGAMLDECRSRGMGIAIDDFGTGYSSLSHLSTLPITTLKVDRAFITSMSTDRTSRKIIGTILRLAEELDIPVVAEGVEHDREADALEVMGCQYAQGYLFGKPASFDHTLALTSQWTAPTIAVPLQQQA